MRTTLMSIAAALLFGSSSALMAQTEVFRYEATAETSYGVVYTLPRTEIEIEATVLERVYMPGPLRAYAEKYLAQPAGQHQTKQYSLLSLKIKGIGLPDTTKRYVVTFDKRTVAPFVKLTQDNILHSINAGEGPCSETKAQPLVFAEPDRKLPSLPREYAQAGSVNKQAEVAASHLYELRERLLGVVTGEVEQMPKDGEAMCLVLDQLKAEERRTLRLFMGDTTQRTITHTLRISPDGNDIQSRILFRFSPDWGIVDGDDLSGDPVLLNLKVIERAPELSEKERKKLAKIEGIMYNVPGVAVVSVSLLGKELSSERISLTQAGGMQSLTKKMFNVKDKTGPSVYFDIHSGAIVSIRQE